MAVNNNHKPLFGTQARILMTEWQALAKLIMVHSVPAKEKPITNIEELESFDIENLENITFSTAEEIPPILSEKYLQTALQGPFGSLIKEKMTAYAKITRLRLEIHLNKEEPFKQRRVTLPEAEQIPAKKLEKLSFPQLDTLQKDLDELTEQHNQEWQQFIQDWTERLINYLTAAHLKPTARELKELRDEDVVTEILPRFIEVGLRLPKKEYPEMSFADYLHLKAILVVQSALSRQHLAHDDSDIAQQLKNFQADLKEMDQAERQLSATQQEQTQQVISSII